MSNKVPMAHMAHIEYTTQKVYGAFGLHGARGAHDAISRLVFMTSSDEQNCFFLFRGEAIARNCPHNLISGIASKFDSIVFSQFFLFSLFNGLDKIGSRRLNKKVKFSCGILDHTVISIEQNKKYSIFDSFLSKLSHHLD